MSASAIIYMKNYKKPSLLTPPKKEERKLTYIGMLIETKQEKRKQGGLVLVFSSSCIKRQLDGYTRNRPR